MAQQKTSFSKWWKSLTGTTKAAKVGLFHIDLVDSIVYAGVPVHYSVGGKTRCQGYIPTIVSKCGWFLKENATTAKGIFRVSGSAKRVAELQLIFDTPPYYGSQLDWKGFTIHDASNVLRRYLNYLPDPVITLEYYEKFRDVHRNLTDDTEMIAAYQEIITKLPPPHSCLLMYLLDFLALFAHHADENLMDSRNLASVFQPGVLSHPDHALSPGEYMTSAAVLKFLIDNQSSFTMPKPNIDEDDEELANFGILDQQQRPPLLTTLTGGYVSAAEHERLYDAMNGQGGKAIPSEEGTHVLDAAMKRQLSLHKPIIPRSTLPGHAPTRSKSTNSSTSSRHSNSNIFSSTFLVRRRSSRNSKTSSRVIATESEPYTPSEKVRESVHFEDKVHIAAEKDLSVPRSNSIRKAATTPSIPSEEPKLDLTQYMDRRKQLRSEGLRREPSIFCQEIEIQFPAPIIEGTEPKPFLPSTPSTIITRDRGNQRISTSGASSKALADTQYQSAPTLVRNPFPPTPTAHVHIPDLPIRQREDYTPPPPSGARSAAGQKRASAAAAPIRHPEGSDQGSSLAQRPNVLGMTIHRAKSNPGQLTAVESRHRGQDSSSSHNGGHHKYEMLKGWISGKSKHGDAAGQQDDKDAGKESKKDKRRESLTDKQQKHKAQDGSRGSSTNGTIHEHDQSDIHKSSKPPATAPQRPRPPPPESSRMDMLDPPQPIGHHSGHSSPSGSRSGSPSRVPPSRHAPTSSSSSGRLLHGKGSPQGSTSSFEGFLGLPPSSSEDHPAPHRPRPPRHSGHSYSQQHLLPLDESNHRHGLFHSSHDSLQRTPSPSTHSRSSFSSNPTSGLDTEETLNRPLYDLNNALSPRSRQGSFGSTDGSDAPPVLAPKSRERRLPRHGSTVSSQGSPSLSPLSRSMSNQPAGYHHHGSSPLASLPPPNHQGQAHVGLGLDLNKQQEILNTPSARAKSRVRGGKDEARSSQQLHSQQPSNPTSPPPSRDRTQERERSRSYTSPALSGSFSTSPLIPLPPPPPTLATSGRPARSGSASRSPLRLP